MQFARNKKQYRLAVNMTSMVDVLFLLVLFFMLTSHFAVFEAIPVSVGISDGIGEERMEQKNDDIVIYVGEDGMLDVNELTMEPVDLLIYLAPRLKHNPKRAITITPKEGASVQYLMTTVDMVRKTGAKNLTLSHIQY